MNLLTSGYTGDRYRLFTVAGAKNIWRNATLARTFAGKLRSLWHAFYDGELCDFCGRRYDNALWWCPDGELFARIVDVPYQPPYSCGLCCPLCFDKRARALGLTLEWNPRLFIDRSVTPTREYLRPPPPPEVRSCK